MGAGLVRMARAKGWPLERNQLHAEFLVQTLETVLMSDGTYLAWVDVHGQRQRVEGGQGETRGGLQVDAGKS